MGGMGGGGMGYGRDIHAVTVTVTVMGSGRQSSHICVRVRGCNTAYRNWSIVGRRGKGKSRI
jgi:hypothetical protein